MSAWLQSEAAYFWIMIPAFTLGIILLLRGWVGHRARGTPRCRNCYYSLKGSASLTCPECGRAHRSEREALRPRFYWKRLTLGLLLASISGYALFWPDIAVRRNQLNESWYLAMVPTSLLIQFLPDANEDHLKLLDQRLVGINQAHIIDVWSTGYDFDGETRWVDHSTYRSVRFIDRIPPQQRRWLARKCIALLDLPLPAQELIDSDDGVVWDQVLGPMSWRREHAVYWLAALQRDEREAIPRLMQLVRNREYILIREGQVAVNALSSITFPSAELTEFLAEEAIRLDGNIQMIAVESLAKLRRSDPRVIAAMKPLIRSGDGEIRESVLMTLARMRPVTDEMVAVIRDELLRQREDSWSNANEAMVALGVAAVPVLIEDLMKFPEPDENDDSDRGYLVPHLILSDIGLPALPALMKLLDHPEKRIRDRSASIIATSSQELASAALPLLQDRLHAATSETQRTEIKELIAWTTRNMRDK